jgi:hypothetical protein
MTHSHYLDIPNLIVGEMWEGVKGSYLELWRVNMKEKVKDL